jgi:hypothetical protein
LTELVRHRGGPFEFDDYTYGPGGAAFLSFEFDLPDGTTHTMTLRGAFPELQIEAYDTGGEFAPFSIETSIDKDSAKLFGWRAHGVRFNFDWYLMDFNRDDFDEPARFGRSYGDLSITGTDVPEPALMALLPLGVGLAFRRRRRRCSSDT